MRASGAMVLQRWCMPLCCCYKCLSRNGSSPRACSRSHLQVVAVPGTHRPPCCLAVRCRQRERCIPAQTSSYMLFTATSCVRACTHQDREQQQQLGTSSAAAPRPSDSQPRESPHSLVYRLAVLMDLAKVCNGVFCASICVPSDENGGEGLSWAQQRQEQQDRCSHAVKIQFMR